MADIFTKDIRSKIMAKVRGSETKPEIEIRKHLFALGFRFRKNVKHLPGRPDILLPKYRTVVFVHGCFWHGHKNCEASKLPKSRLEYWSKKIASNVIRDKSNVRKLRRLGYQVLVIWECQLGKSNTLESLNNKILKQKK